MSQLLKRFAFFQLPLNSIHSCDVDSYGGTFARVLAAL